jgi:hypothetical protein
MKTFLQFVESIASDPRIGGHDAANPYKRRYNAFYNKHEVVNTGKDTVVSHHDTEDDADEKIKSMKESNVTPFNYQHSNGSKAILQNRGTQIGSETKTHATPKQAHDYLVSKGFNHVNSMHEANNN